MSTVLYNPITVNPQAYLVFPGLYELIPNTTDYIEYCTYTGILEIHIDNQLVKQYEHTDSIDLSEFVNNQIRISLVTELGSVLLGEWIIDQSRTAIPESIRKNLVVWYDVAKQNATNESMQANPVLKDFSGNGHDATCYNFAWSGNSGIGGVIEDFTSNYYQSFLNGARGKGIVTYNKIHITQVGDNSLNIRFFELERGANGNKSYKIRVTGIEENKPLAFSGAIISGSDIPSETLVLIDHDGEYTIPETDASKIRNAGYRANGWTGACDIIIEQLPAYPHALVSDGVDDFATVSGLPLFTTETGYTVIAKRKIFNHETDTKSIPIFCKGDRSSANESFGVELYSNNINVTKNFFKTTPIELQEDDISFQTSMSYNGQIIRKGESVDGKSLYICTNENQNGYKSIALYSFLLFDRDLTDEEIEWVKTNLIEQ